MKKLILIAGLMIPLAAMGQRSIDRLFERYAGRDGFTTITLTGNLLKLAANFGDEDDRDINARITGIRILTEDDETRGTVNFLDMISRDLDDKDYEEFMSVKKSDQDLRMLVKLEGRRIREFLLVAGGEDNAIIQVTGDMSVSDARRLSENAKRNKGVSVFAENE